ncbi:GatB/YqeY domain-containing protein [Chloroflexota bacterium]
MEENLKEKLKEDLKQAMKSGDTERRSVLRLVLAAVKNAEIAKQNTLENSDVLGILSKEVKQHEESIEAFTKGNRPDLASKEEAELVIIQEYLPEQITRDEIMAEARRIIEEVGAEGPRDKGKVMPRIVAELKGKADGREINDVVTELLAS